MQPIKANGNQSTSGRTRAGTCVGASGGLRVTLRGLALRKKSAMSLTLIYEAEVQKGLVERLFNDDSSDEEGKGEAQQMMKQKRWSVQELLDLKKLRDVSDMEDRNMLASFPEPKRFKGWKEKMVHAGMVNQSNLEPGHGYYRHLYCALKADQPGSQERRAVYGEDEGSRKDASSFLWPPVLLVNNAAAHKLAHKGAEATGKLKEVRAVYSRQDRDNVVVYPAMEVGYVDASQLKKKLEACRQHPEELMQVDHRRYQTLRVPLEEDDDGNSSSDDSAFSRRELELPGNRSKRAHEDDALLVKRKAGDESKFHWRLKKATEWVEVDPVKGLCQKWVDAIKLTHDSPGYVESHPWRLTDKQRQADLKCKEQLQQVRLQRPVTKKAIGDEVKGIERQLRREKLLWLQELDAVRERFRTLADDVKEDHSRKILDREISIMQQEKEEEQQLEAREEELAKANSERFDRDLFYLQNRKRAESQAENQALVHDWIAEEKILEQEVMEARRTRKRMRRRLHRKLSEEAKTD